MRKSRIGTRKKVHKAKRSADLLTTSIYQLIDYALLSPSVNTFHEGGVHAPIDQTTVLPTPLGKSGWCYGFARVRQMWIKKKVLGRRLLDMRQERQGKPHLYPVLFNGRCAERIPTWVIEIVVWTLAATTLVVGFLELAK